MANHINYLKSLVEQPLSIAQSLVSDQTDRHHLKKRSFIMKKDIEVEGRVMQVTEEVVKNPATAQMITVHKIYVFTLNSLDYSQIGWIHRSDIKRCMVCNEKFGLMAVQHNCVACGHVICQKCSPHSSVIAELNSQERFRVCKRCFTGKGKLHALKRPESDQKITEENEDREEKSSDPLLETMEFIVNTMENEALHPELAVQRQLKCKLATITPELIKEFEAFMLTVATSEELEGLGIDLQFDSKSPISPFQFQMLETFFHSKDVESDKKKNKKDKKHRHHEKEKSKQVSKTKTAAARKGEDGVDAKEEEEDDEDDDDDGSDISDSNDSDNSENPDKDGSEEEKEEQPSPAEQAIVIEDVDEFDRYGKPNRSQYCQLECIVS